MQYTSQAYKTEQKQPLRNEQYVYVSLGVISQEAQTNAVANGTFTDYTDTTSVFLNPTFEGYYATVEENQAKASDTMFFMPRDRSAYAAYQGLVTEHPLDTITFTFGDYTNLNIKGLTIDFGDYYPTHFSVTNGTNYYEYYNGERGIWKTEDEFLNTSYLTITPIEMVGGQQRLRILGISFGFGLFFDNSSLISTSWVSEVAHLSDMLPTKTFSFTVDNLSRQFSADNPHSYLSFLQEQQEVTFEYGRKLDDGSIFKIPGGKLSLKSWSSNDTQAKFEAVGFLDYSTGKYKKGQYYKNGISLYDLAVDVCEDAGYENYQIDSYLKRIITHNPLPIETHKNLLQLIANASMAIIRESRKGQLEIRTSFMPDVDSVTTNGETSYSNGNNIVTNEMVVDYATIETDYTYSDGHQYFIPRNGSFLESTGYVSSAVSGNDGTFTTNPIVTVQWEAAWTFYDLLLQFKDVAPQEFIVRTYKDNSLIDEFTVNENVDLYTTVRHEFIGIDKLSLEFVKTNPGQRIHLSHLEGGSSIDYTLEYSDMTATPTAKRTETLKNLGVAYTKFSYSDVGKELSTVDTTEGLNTIELSNACHDYQVAYQNIIDDTENYDKITAVFCYNLPPVDVAKADTIYFKFDRNVQDRLTKYTLDAANKTWTQQSTLNSIVISKVSSLPSSPNTSYIYFVSVNAYTYHAYQYISGAYKSYGYAVCGNLSIVDTYAYTMSFTTDIPHPVVVYGNEFIVSERYYTEQFADVGVDKTANNVLIDNEAHAQAELSWLYDYYSNDVEYTIKYRGEPAIDPDDLIYIENKFVDDNIVRVTDSTIATGTGMSTSCIIHGRRVAYAEKGGVTTILLHGENQPIVNEACDVDVEGCLIPEEQWTSLVAKFGG